jgi:hypothetical protein
MYENKEKHQHSGVSGSPWDSRLILCTCSIQLCSLENLPWGVCSVLAKMRLEIPPDRIGIHLASSEGSEHGQAASCKRAGSG